MTDRPDSSGSEDARAACAGSHDALAAREPSIPAQAGLIAPVPVPTAVFAKRRAELGLSLEDVANQLKFSARQIESLEAGDFERLPGGTFARGMLRGYARLLKLDPTEILAQLAASGAKPQVAPEQAVSLRTPIPFSEGGKHVNLVYAVLSVLILAVVAFFAVEWYQEKGGAGELAFVSPKSPRPPDSAGRAAPGPPVDGSGVQPQPPTTLASAGLTSLPASAPRPDERPADGKVATPVPAVLASLAPGKRRIVMRFKRESWVEIRTVGGKMLLSQLNPAGSEKVIEGDPPFSLVIGNAHSVLLFYNDQPVDLRPHFHVDVARLTLN